MYAASVYRSAIGRENLLLKLSYRLSAVACHSHWARYGLSLGLALETTRWRRVGGAWSAGSQLASEVVPSGHKPPVTVHRKPAGEVHSARWSAPSLGQALRVFARLSR